LEYKYISQDTLGHLYLHDCIINRVEQVGSSLIFYFEWINVLKTHPFNKTGKSKITRKSLLVFDNASVIFCKYYDMVRAYAKGEKTDKKIYRVEEEADIVDVDLFEFCRNIEILDDKEENIDGEKTWYCLCTKDFQLKIKYSCSYVHFNGLEENAWFERDDS